MKKIIVIVGMVVVSLCFLITSANAVIEISDCTDCSVDGETYLLNQSIINSVTPECINISGNNITLDLGGYIVDGMLNVDDGIVIKRGVPETTNITIKNGTVAGWCASLGGVANVHLTNANGNTFENLIIKTSNKYGLMLKYSDNNTILNTTIKDNKDLDIDCDQSDNNTFRNILMPLNGTYANTFFFNYADSNEIINLTMSGYLDLYHSEFNIIRDSRFQNCAPRALDIDQEGNNYIYNCYFNNTNNVGAIAGLNTNYWNTTKQLGNNIVDSSNSYIGGNYWGNPTETGYSDTCIDSNKDGFCDTPYAIAVNNVDFLPLCLIVPTKVYYLFEPATVPIDFEKSEEFDNFTGNESWTNFTGLVETMYTDVIGNVFYLVIFGLPILMLWLRQENVIMPIVMGLIVGVAGFSLLPPEYRVVSITFLGLSFAAIVFTIFKSRR